MNAAFRAGECRNAAFTRRPRVGRKKRKRRKEGSFILWLRIDMAAILELCEEIFVSHGARVSSHSNVRRPRALKNVEHAS